MTIRLALPLLLAGAASLAPPAALAQYACSVTAAGTVNFMAYNPSSSTPAIASTQTTLTCTHVSGGAQSIDWAMTLTSGGSGNCSQRRMSRPGDSLNYNIYQDSIAGGVWGNAGCATFPAGNMRVTPGGPNRTRSVTRTLYGQVPIGQFVSAGTYHDTLVLTITY
jgi:spore coat protein U-like protein